MPTARRTRAALALVMSAGSALGVAGCGGTRAPTVDRATAVCRATWRDLDKQLSGRDTGTGPSQLADRWSAIIAGVRYHASSARPSDCDRPLTAERAAITALEGFQSKVQVFDMELTRDTLNGPARDWLATPLPKRSSLGKAGKPVSHHATRKALGVLEEFASQASQDLADGWAEAESVDVDDPKAVKGVLSDLGLLASHSAAYRRCARAEKVLRKVLRQQVAMSSGTTKPSPSGH